MQFAADSAASGSPASNGASGGSAVGDPGGPGGDRQPPAKPGKDDPTKYYARFDLSGARSIKQLEDILRNVADHLAAVEGSSVSLTLEVNASGPAFDERTVRVVRENAGQLQAKANEFEP